MRGTYSSLVNSKFFHPAFNSAIFDGPVRIYFAQLHESLALKIYFCIQKAIANELNQAREFHKLQNQTLLVLLYPNKESFGLAFENTNETFLGYGELFEDSVVGINGPFEDDQLPMVVNEIKKVFQSWNQLKSETKIQEYDPRQEPVEISL